VNQNHNKNLAERCDD